MVALRLPKPLILLACKEKQQHTIEDFQREIADLKVQLFEREETESQQQHTSPERQELLLRLEHELDFLNSEMSVLQNIKSEQRSDEVELGAVVVTNQRIFYISTSIERIDVEGQAVIGISVKAPIYQAMRGKKAGESFTYGGVRFDILEVY